jgi:hypothetical protein
MQVPGAWHPVTKALRSFEQMAQLPWGQKKMRGDVSHQDEALGTGRTGAYDVACRGCSEVEAEEPMARPRDVGVPGIPPAPGDPTGALCVSRRDREAIVLPVVRTAST